MQFYVKKNKDSISYQNNLFNVYHTHPRVSTITVSQLCKWRDFNDRILFYRKHN